MTDLEISKALALAIGWREDQIGSIKEMKISDDNVVTWEDVCVTVKFDGRRYGFPFWYTDWNVIGPIAERYDAFPLQSCVPGMWSSTACGRDSDMYTEDTPQKAIAMCVINGVKK